MNKPVDQALKKVLGKYPRIIHPIIRHLLKGHDPEQTLSKATPQLTRLILEACTEAHQASEQIIINQANQHKKLALASVQRQATRATLRRTTEQIEALYRPRIETEVTKLTTNLARAIRTSISSSVSKNEPLRQTIIRLKDTIDASGLEPQSPWALETIARTESQIAYAQAQKDISQDPDIQEILWGWQYSAIEDSRVEPSHLALDGVLIAKDDPRLPSMTPPLRFNCRCTLIAVFTKPDRYESPQIEVPRELPLLL
jgi:SPP1 gp7 family putative phage head morphogenesis protein